MWLSRFVTRRRLIVSFKVPPLSCFSLSDKTTEEQIDREILARDQLINEVKLMHNSRHPNILTFYGVCFDKPPVMIVMELCPGDSLFKHLRNTNRGAISTGERFKYSIEAAEGMEFLHRTYVILVSQPNFDRILGVLFIGIWPRGTA